MPEVCKTHHHAIVSLSTMKQEKGNDGINQKTISGWRMTGGSGSGYISSVSLKVSPPSNSKFMRVMGACQTHYQNLCRWAQVGWTDWTGRY